ncbi:hypothetical protein PHJA_001163200 [Phtheirospermum japonicum]|uniref:Stigma-specific Stig1 family protein n=1 Tax=Phtheirospermum japonicum TaxID=374723 RepID=A0A830C218_9LAMI|nr:hypothetical protein PHJA_001163200 [Phtheirospermum japonicum]
MRCLQFIIFSLAMVIMALAIPLSAESNNFPENAGPTSLRGVNRFLAQRTRVSFTRCDKYPKVCHAKGSPGRDCCKKRCVNVANDRLSCGKCDHKCKFSEICCKGKCVNPLGNKKHCGGCNNRCKKGSKCVYGMCSYA